jgi:hypothetical protein
MPDAVGFPAVCRAAPQRRETQPFADYGLGIRALQRMAFQVGSWPQCAAKAVETYYEHFPI